MLYLDLLAKINQFLVKKTCQIQYFETISVSGVGKSIDPNGVRARFTSQAL